MKKTRGGKSLLWKRAQTGGTVDFERRKWPIFKETESSERDDHLAKFQGGRKEKRETVQPMRERLGNMFEFSMGKSIDLREGGGKG